MSGGSKQDKSVSGSDGKPSVSGYTVTWVPNKQGKRMRQIRKFARPTVWTSTGRRARFVSGKGSR
jgi:hypothetical protein